MPNPMGTMFDQKIDLYWLFDLPSPFVCAFLLWKVYSGDCKAYRELHKDVLHAVGRDVEIFNAFANMDQA